MASASSRQHLPTLDGVRGLAILMVIAHNATIFGDHLSPFGHVLSLAADLGWIGVQLFFVLSGFLITGILLDTREAGNYYQAFFGRRVLRIFPLYYATLFVGFVVLPHLTAHAPDGRHQIWLWTYLANWTDPLGLNTEAFPHFWSLAVEEQFYLVWPLVVRALAPRRLLGLCVALALASLLSRVGLRLAGVGPEIVYRWTFCRMDALVGGAAVAAVLRLPHSPAVIERWRSSLAGGVAALGLGGFLATRGFPRETFGTQTVGYSIITLVFATLVLFAVRDDARGSGWLRATAGIGPLRTVGKYSYAMYVFQSPLHRFIQPRFLHRWAPSPSGVGLGLGLLYFAVVGGLSFLAAFASYHLFEKYFLRLKRRFVPSFASTSA